MKNRSRDLIECDRCGMLTQRADIRYDRQLPGMICTQCLQQLDGDQVDDTDDDENYYQGSV